MTLIYFSWAAEFLLQSIGAALNWKTSKLLSLVLAFLSLSDLFTFGVFQLNARLYPWASWGQTAGKYLLLIWLACEIIGLFVNKRSRAQAKITAAFISLASASFVIVFFSQGEALKDKLLDGEIAANMVLFVIVSLGWISQARYLNRHWRWIAAGFVVLIGWDLAVTVLWKFFWAARQYYPVGTIAAYVVWIAGPLRGLGEFRASLGSRLEVPKEVITTRLM